MLCTGWEARHSPLPLRPPSQLINAQSVSDNSFAAARKSCNSGLSARWLVRRAFGLCAGTHTNVGICSWRIRTPKNTRCRLELSLQCANKYYTIRFSLNLFKETSILNKYYYAKYSLMIVFYKNIGFNNVVCCKPYYTIWLNVHDKIKIIINTIWFSSTCHS